ncbi:Thiamine-phosphate synthase [Aquimixticola soesokkakensis]|uniref:Thiamine-phosphate synthase n=1 Tax=Aquimixticola soesokkakensis TaxID=1519096 RepID=A0A1Y5TH44_9RHOB|nr:thiamine phosphate synthase [Aquimixticola soesokkakensis]SLN64093.1 Thiamine-phosphate synthase [Aquimixticola soesokkakensis]
MERFYPIVGHVDLLAVLVPRGAKLVQLRLKDVPPEDLRRQIARARDICAAHGAQLVVNDHWQLALELDCDFVHLGQEDMETADFPALRRAGLRFGLSTHDTAELERALALHPAYVALGPVYPTRLKKMKWAPQGLDRLADWKRRAPEVPLVAIGGLTPERAAGVFGAGADSLAVVSDLQQASDPAARLRLWQEVCAR